MNGAQCSRRSEQKKVAQRLFQPLDFQRQQRPRPERLFKTVFNLSGVFEGFDRAACLRTSFSALESMFVLLTFSLAVQTPVTANVQTPPSQKQTSEMSPGTRTVSNRPKKRTVSNQQKKQTDNSAVHVSSRTTEKDLNSVELDQRRLWAIVDPVQGLKTPGVRAEERDVFYYVLAKVQQVDQQKLKEAARQFLAKRRQLFPDEQVRNGRRPFPVFVDMYRCSDKPKVYLGQPVTVFGHIRLLRGYKASSNPYGIKWQYEAWLYTPDSQSNPVCIVCTKLPPGMLEAFQRSPRHLLEGVQATGYFFKYMVYRAQDAFRFAPLILAATLQWKGSGNKKAFEQTASRGMWLVAGLMSVILVLVGFVASAEYQRKLRTRKMLKQLREPSESEPLAVVEESTKPEQTR